MYVNPKYVIPPQVHAIQAKIIKLTVLVVSMMTWSSNLIGIYKVNAIKMVANVILLKGSAKSVNINPPVFLPRYINSKILSKNDVITNDTATDHTPHPKYLINTRDKITFTTMVTRLTFTGVSVSLSA